MPQSNNSGTTADQFEIGTDGPILRQKPGTNNLILPIHTQGAPTIDNLQSDEILEIGVRRQLVVYDELIIEGELYVEGNLILE